jgi:hypothetical protein
MIQQYYKNYVYSLNFNELKAMLERIDKDRFPDKYQFICERLVALETQHMNEESILREELENSENPNLLQNENTVSKNKSEKIILKQVNFDDNDSELLIKRNIKLTTIINTLKGKTLILFNGFIITFFSVMFFGLSLYSFSDSDIPKVNYSKIRKNGIQLSAKLTNIEVMTNIAINGVNPIILSYNYQVEGSSFESKYISMSISKVNSLSVGDNIAISHYNGKSIVNNFEPYNFYSSLSFIPLFPVFFGLIILINPILYLTRRFHLYKYGKVKMAKILIMSPKSQFFPFQISNRIVIQYKFISDSGELIKGEADITDFSLVNNFKVNELVPIFVSRKNENHSCVVPLSESIRNNWDIKFNI